jgi:hypothetical protein
MMTFGKRLALIGSILVASAVTYVTPGAAQATRTWVSGVGDDANPCSRTAPCKTFAGAISKTANKGEISVLDPGGFGTVTITKSITINGEGTLAGVLSAGTNGINVNDSATATPDTIEVNLRYLSINGAGTGLDGIKFISGKKLSIEHCLIQNVTGDGIEVTTSTPNTTGGAFLSVTDTRIEQTGAVGLNIAPANGPVNIKMDNVNQFRSATNSGLFLSGDIRANISNSSFSGNHAGAGVVLALTADTMLDHVRAVGNGTGVLNNNGSPVTRLKDCTLTGNITNGANNIAGTMTGFQSNIITNPAGVIGSVAPTH